MLFGDGVRGRTLITYSKKTAYRIAKCSLSIFPTRSIPTLSSQYFGGTSNTTETRGADLLWQKYSALLQLLYIHTRNWWSYPHMTHIRHSKSHYPPGIIEKVSTPCLPKRHTSISEYSGARRATVGRTHLLLLLLATNLIQLFAPIDRAKDTSNTNEMAKRGESEREVTK